MIENLTVLQGIVAALCKHVASFLLDSMQAQHCAFHLLPSHYYDLLTY